MGNTAAPVPPPTEAPKPANPEPLQPGIDPEKGGVDSGPLPGKPEHPEQMAWSDSRRAPDALQEIATRSCASGRNGPGARAPAGVLP